MDPARWFTSLSILMHITAPFAIANEEPSVHLEPACAALARFLDEYPFQSPTAWDPLTDCGGKRRLEELSAAMTPACRLASVEGGPEVRFLVDAADRLRYGPGVPCYAEQRRVAEQALCALGSKSAIPQMARIVRESIWPTDAIPEIIGPCLTAVIETGGAPAQTAADEFIKDQHPPPRLILASILAHATNATRERLAPMLECMTRDHREGRDFLYDALCRAYTPHAQALKAACASAGPDLEPVWRKASLEREARDAAERHRREIWERLLNTAETLSIAAMCLALVIRCRRTAIGVLMSIACGAVGAGFFAFDVSFVMSKDTFGWGPLFFTTLGTIVLGPIAAVLWGRFIYRMTTNRHRLYAAVGSIALSFANVLVWIWR